MPESMPLVRADRGWVWHAESFTAAERSTVLQAIALDLCLRCQRSFNKATDPGVLDNLAAGGMPADEDPAQCAQREIFEEAGLERSLTDLCQSPLELLTERAEIEGWHSERLFAYTVKVIDFLCLSIPEVMARLRAGEFTPDAACAIALSALQGDLC